MGQVGRGWLRLRFQVRLGCMYVCMFVCMYVCMFVCLSVSLFFVLLVLFCFLSHLPARFSMTPSKFSEQLWFVCVFVCSFVCDMVCVINATNNTCAFEYSWWP